MPLLEPYDYLADEPLVAQWLADPSIGRWFPDASLDDLSRTQAFLIMLDRLTPAGFLAFAHVGIAGSADLCCVMVDPRWQRQGVARRAIVEGIGKLPQGVERVFLRVARGNLSARRLYGRLGFVQVRETPTELVLVRHR